MDQITIERKIMSINADLAAELKSYDSRIRRAKKDLANHAALAASHCRELKVECTDGRTEGWKKHYEDILTTLKSLRATVADTKKKLRHPDYAECLARKLIYAD